MIEKKAELVRGDRIIYLAHIHFADRTYRRWVVVGSKQLYESLPIGANVEMDVGRNGEFTEVLVDIRNLGHGNGD